MEDSTSLLGSRTTEISSRGSQLSLQRSGSLSRRSDKGAPLKSASHCVIQITISERKEIKQEIQCATTLITTVLLPGALTTYSFRSSVWLDTGHTSRPTSAFLYLIRSLTWANGGSSRRNARYRGYVCVDRFLSWCFVLLLVEPWLKTQWRDGRNLKKH